MIYQSDVEFYSEENIWITDYIFFVFLEKNLEKTSSYFFLSFLTNKNLPFILNLTEEKYLGLILVGQDFFLVGQVSFCLNKIG